MMYETIRSDEESSKIHNLAYKTQKEITESKKIENALIIAIYQEYYAIRLSSILQILKVSQDKIDTYNGKRILKLQNDILPLITLADVFKTPSSSKTKSYIIITEQDGQKFGIVVDELIGQEEAIIYPCTFREVDQISGAVIKNKKVIPLIELSRIIKQQKNITKNNQHQTTINDNDFQKQDYIKNLQGEFIHFSIESKEYALSILNTLEIIQPIDYARVPGNPQNLLGIFNFHQYICPLIDLRLQPIINQKIYYLIIKYEEKIAGLIIEKPAILKLQESTFSSDEPLYIHQNKDRIITILEAQNLLKKIY